MGGIEGIDRARSSSKLRKKISLVASDTHLFTKIRGRIKVYVNEYLAGVYRGLQRSDSKYSRDIFSFTAPR